MQISEHTFGRQQALAFRLDTHNLARRLPPGSLLQAAACGVQNTPPGSAALSLHARVSGLTPLEVQAALETDKTLLQVWSMRGAPTIFPTREAAAFTLGLLPEDEETLRAFIPGIEVGLEQVGMDAVEVTTLTADAVRVVLDGRVLANKRRLDTALARQVAQVLPAGQQAAWHLPSPYGPNQLLGEALVSFSLRPVALQGLICFAHRPGREATFARTEQWLGEPLPGSTPEQARRDLVRRYLRCYGPSTPEHFANWAGIGPAQAKATWNKIEAELAAVALDGRRAWLYRDDLPRWQSPPEAEGVRFLPPHDPYLQQRDRETLLPDSRRQRQVWRTVGNPGVVLLQGEIAAIWRTEKKGSLLKLRLTPFLSLTGTSRAEIEAEAQTLAAYRGCTRVEVQWLEHEQESG